MGSGFQNDCGKDLLGRIQRRTLCVKGMGLRRRVTEERPVLLLYDVSLCLALRWGRDCDLASTHEDRVSVECLLTDRVPTGKKSEDSDQRRRFMCVHYALRDEYLTSTGRRDAGI